MAQTTYYINGKAQYPQLTAERFDKKFKCWTVDLVMEDDQITEFKKWGSELHLRDVDTAKESDTGTMIKVRRPMAKLIKDQLVKFDPPELLGPDNKPWDPKVAIGNGSDVTLKVIVYDSAKGKGVRLEAVRVNVHVPFAQAEVDTSNVDSPF